MGLSLTYTSYIVEVSLSWATQSVETFAVCLLLLGAASDFLQNLIQHSVRASVFTQFVYTPFQYALHALQHRMQCLDDSAGPIIFALMSRQAVGQVSSCPHVRY